MIFNQLSKDLQDKLNAYGLYLVRYSSSVAVPRGTVDDAIRLASAADALSQTLQNYKGYTIGQAQMWFDFVAASLDNVKGTQLAQNALLIP